MKLKRALRKYYMTDLQKILLPEMPPAVTETGIMKHKGINSLKVFMLNAAVHIFIAALILCGLSKYGEDSEISLKFKRFAEENALASQWEKLPVSIQRALNPELQ